MTRRLTTGMVAALYLLSMDPAAGQEEALRFVGEFTVRASRPSDWRNWRVVNTFASGIFSCVDSSGLFEISSAGIVPRYFSGAQNYVLDRSQYSYQDNVRYGGAAMHGSITARSNPVSAPLVGDGDPHTFWEPADEDFTEDGMRNWQLEVDLGRVTWADSMVILFPPLVDGEDTGDPPRLFTVSASVGQAKEGRKELQFEEVGRVSVQDSTRRRVVLPLEPFGRADFDGDGTPDFTGSFVHYVRLTIFDSKLLNRKLLGSGEEGRRRYEGAPPERRGLKVYQRVSAGGTLVRVDSTTYFGELTGDERGPIRYYERELPRVGEIEVWGRGANLAYRPERHAGASFEDGGRGNPAGITDGLYATEWSSQPWQPKYSSNVAGSGGQVGRTVWLDLGASFWVDTIYLGSRLGYRGGNIVGYHLLGSAGQTVQPISMVDETDFAQLEPGLAWTDLLSDIHRDNIAAGAQVLGEFFPLRKLRFLQLRNLVPEGYEPRLYNGSTGTFSEVQIHGQGYPAEVNVTTPPFVLLPGIGAGDAGAVEQSRSLARILWDAEAVVRRGGEAGGHPVEVAEPLGLHPEVSLQLRTRTSETIDSLFTYYEVTGLGTSSEKRKEIPLETYLKRVADVVIDSIYQAQPSSRVVRLQPHRTGRDDDGDGRVDEDLMDGSDNDGDGLIDEDGRTGDLGGPNDRGTITLLKHKRGQDDDGDHLVDEDWINGTDDDGDGLIDEDGKKPPSLRKFPDHSVTPVFADWSPWSSPYLPRDGRNEATIVSPSPRKFLQVRATIASSDPNATARLKSVVVELAPPISTEAVGELAIVTGQGLERPIEDLQVAAGDYAPPVGIEPASEQAYAYFVRAACPDATVPGVEDGFNELLLLIPSGVDISGVRLGRVRVTDDDEEAVAGVQPRRRAGPSIFYRAWVRTEGAGVLREVGGGQEVEVLASGDSVLLSFPESINRGMRGLDHALLEVRFASVTPRAGIQFRASLRHRRPNGETGVFQRVEILGQDATELVDSQTVTPLIRMGHGLIEGLHVDRVMTPNGDGINDRIRVRFVLLHLQEERPIRVDFYDLGGRCVASDRLEAGSGKISLTWDGGDRVGGLVRPGIYLCRIRVRTDRHPVEATRVVHVIY